MRHLFIIFLFFLSTTISGQVAEKRISCHFENAGFSAFCQEVYRQRGISVFYREGDLSFLKVNIDADSISISQALKKILQGTSMHAEEWNDQIVIMKEKKLFTELPDYNFSEKNTAEPANVPSLITESEARYLKGRKVRQNEIIRVGKNTFTAITGKVKILGHITEEETGEPIIGAALIIEELKSGALTDASGYLSMAIKPGTYTVRFEYLGYEKKVCQLIVYSAGSFSIELKKAIIPINEVVITGDRKTSVITKDPGLENISARTIREIPTMLGERDILKVSQLMPGIVSVGEGSSGLNVRGGGSDQNAFYINKIPVYNTSHMFGFFPAFNADIVRDFSIYKGYTPAEYGGRLSSVFNIITRQGNRKMFGMHATVNPLTASLTLEGPIIKDKSSILVSGRTSYSDWILNRFSDPVLKTSHARFNDLSVAMNYDLKKTQISLFGFYTYDYFHQADITQYEYSNRGISLNMRRNFDTDVQADLAVIIASYRFGTTSTQPVSSAYHHGYQIDNYEIRLDMNHPTAGIHQLEYGIDLLLNKLDRGVVEPYGSSLIERSALEKEKGLENSIYISDNVELLPWLKIAAGIRYSLYTVLGPRDVATYIPGFPTDSRYIQDTIHYADNKALKWYHNPEARLSLNFKTDPKGSVKLAFNQMHQSIIQLSNTIAISPNSQWKTADTYLVPARSNQFSLGIFRNFPKSGWETSLEGFYKFSKNFSEFKDGADFLSDDPTETFIFQGDQHAYGFELWLKRGNRKLNGWIAYTYSRSFVTVNGGQLWNTINKGETYPSNYDIPHVFNALINYHMNRRISLSTVVTYQTGRHITYPLSVYYVDGVPYTDYSQRNEFNIPDYFRIDASVILEGNLRKEKPLHSSLIFGVYNMLGRNNAYSVFFRPEYGTLKSYKYSVIAVPIFTVTWQVKLGNYATE